MTTKQLIWEDAGTDEVRDQNASTRLVPHGYWALGPGRSGRWTLTLVEQNDDLDIVSEYVSGPFATEDDAKAYATQAETRGL